MGQGGLAKDADALMGEGSWLQWLAVDLDYDETVSVRANADAQLALPRPVCLEFGDSAGRERYRPGSAALRLVVSAPSSVCCARGDWAVVAAGLSRFGASFGASRLLLSSAHDHRQGRPRLLNPAQL